MCFSEKRKTDFLPGKVIIKNFKVEYLHKYKDFIEN